MIVTVGARPASPSSGIRAGTATRMLTVGASIGAPVSGSVPVSLVTTISAPDAISEGEAARRSLVAARFRARYSRASASAWAR